MFRFAHLSLRDLAHYRGRTALAIAGIGLVVTVYVVLGGIAEGLGGIAGQAGSAENILLLDAKTPFLDNAVIPGDAPEKLAEVSGVGRAVPMLFRHVLVGDSTVHLRAVPLGSYREALGPRLLSGRWLEGKGKAIAAESLAKYRRWAIGQTLNIAREQIQIVGIFRAEGFMNSEIWVSLEDGARLLDRHEDYSMMMAVLDDSADPEAVRRGLDRQFPDLRVVFEKAYFQDANRGSQQARDVMFMVAGVALVAIVFGVFNVSSMTAAERRREVAILKATGVGRFNIAVVFLLEGAALALAGLVLGLAAGSGAVAWLRASSAINLADVAVQPTLTAQVVATGAAATLLFGLLGALLPARRAANVPVAELLRE